MPAIPKPAISKPTLSTSVRAARKPAPAMAEATPTHDESARDRLVAAAKELFARRGYNHVSIRDIATLAGTNSALIAYYFGSKEALFRHVYFEAARPINEERIVLFDALERAPRKPTIEAVIAAWLRPMFHMKSLANGSPISEMSLSLTADHAELSDQMNTEIYSEVNERLLVLLESRLPGASRRSLAWRLYFLIGAVVTITRPHAEGMRRFSHGDCAGEDAEEMMRELISYAAAGFRSVPREQGSS